MKTNKSKEPKVSRKDPEKTPVEKALGIIESMANENEHAFWVALELHIANEDLNNEHLVPMSRALSTLAGVVAELVAWDENDEDPLGLRG